MKMKKNNSCSHKPALITMCILCLSAIIVLSGCSLAKADSTGKESKDDMLCGVWIVSGKDSGSTDMNGFSADDANRLILYCDNSSGESCTMSEANGSIQAELHANVVNGKSTSEYFGTLWVTPDHVINARIYSIYQCPDGTRYAGNDMIPVTANLTTGQSTTYILKSDRTAVSDGTTAAEAIKFQISFEARRPSDSVKVIELGNNNQILKNDTIDLNHPDAESESAFTVDASAETEYVIIEEAGIGSDGGISRTVYNRDDFSADNPYLYTIYLGNADGLLILQSLQITF